MTAIGEDLRSWLLADSAITALVGSRVHQNKAPQGYLGQYIWFRKAATEDEQALDDAVGTMPFRQMFDIECISTDLDEADDLAESVQDLHLSAPTVFGSGSAQVVNLRDHAEDYVPRGDNSDDGRHVSALECEILGYTPGA